ncbi:predicted protein [Arabidopsis lyrata subsp. lyrata]|uniref:Predicted protein n=1 Tax=Arabidopsis lyrata subsp. lyrata TaxID=81972 RepID=D7M795_ARALL|nr:predicted protein [Arabidopsis lyrata subsp. lyrata]
MQQKCWASSIDCCMHAYDATLKLPTCSTYVSEPSTWSTKSARSIVACMHDATLKLPTCSTYVSEPPTWSTNSLEMATRNTSMIKFSMLLF